MSFDINQAVFDSKGTYLEEQALCYEQALMDQFAAAPEGQAITQRGTELGWTRAMIHYAITYVGVTPAAMTASDLEEVIYSLFPRKVITERGDGAEIIQELRAFWHFHEPCVPAAASQADAGTLDATGGPTPGASIAGAGQLWHGQVLCPNGKGGRL
jgi:hypothetical protein